MPPFVHLLVIIYLLFTIDFWWDDGAGTALIQFSSQPIGVEGLVGQQSIEMNAGYQRLDTNHIVPLAGQKDEADQVPQSIYERHDLGRQAAA